MPKISLYLRVGRRYRESNIHVGHSLLLEENILVLETILAIFYRSKSIALATLTCSACVALCAVTRSPSTFCLIFDGSRRSVMQPIGLPERSSLSLRVARRCRLST